MSRKAAKWFLAVWFSLLLLLGNTPMEFVHLFAGHKDTVHQRHQGLSIENKHHHCAFLSLTLHTFLNDFQIPLIPHRLLPHHTAYAGLAPHFVQRAVIETALRGPPAA